MVKGNATSRTRLGDEPSGAERSLEPSAAGILPKEIHLDPEARPEVVDEGDVEGEAAAARLGATELSEKTRAYILEELRRSPAPPDLVPARAVGLLLGAPELQRR